MSRTYPQIRADVLNAVSEASPTGTPFQDRVLITEWLMQRVPELQTPEGLTDRYWCRTHRRTGSGFYCSECVCNIDGCLGSLNNCCVMELSAETAHFGNPEATAAMERVFASPKEGSTHPGKLRTDDADSS